MPLACQMRYKLHCSFRSKRDLEQMRGELIPCVVEYIKNPHSLSGQAQTHLRKQINERLGTKSLIVTGYVFPM